MRPYRASSWSKRSWDTTRFSTNSGNFASAGIADAVRKIVTSASNRRCASVRGNSEVAAFSAVLFVAGGDVGSELGFDELIEDLRQPTRRDRITTRRPKIHAGRRRMDRSRPPLVGDLGVMVRSVGVGEVLPPLHHLAERRVVQLLARSRRAGRSPRRVRRRSVGSPAPERVRKPGRHRCGRPSRASPTTRVVVQQASACGGRRSLRQATSWRSPAATPLV